MRVTTQMLNESARRAGLPINHSSLLDHIGGNGKNALLDALNKKNSTVIDTENKKKYEKLGKTAEKLVNSSDALLQEGEKGIFAQVKESDDKQKLYDSIKTLFADYPIVCEAFDVPDQKAMLVNGLLATCPKTVIVAGSGMAGYEDANAIRTEQRMRRLYVCGDQTTDVGAGIGLMAPRVAICAGHQANKVLQLILENEV